MKLTYDAIDQVLTQLDARPVPADHPLTEKCNDLFGDHTYFLDGQGLKIIELEKPDEAGPPMGRVVKLAAWVDASQTKLAPHDREFTDLVIPLDKAA